VNFPLTRAKTVVLVAVVSLALALLGGLALIANLYLMDTVTCPTELYRWCEAEAFGAARRLRLRLAVAALLVLATLLPVRRIGLVPRLLTVVAVTAIAVLSAFTWHAPW
jgi:hypothetical protein